jgi:integrase
MMLQDLLNRALDQQWFPPSYKGPLQTYVKKYARALDQDPRTCPPHVYHRPDGVVRETILGAADPTLLQRSVKACVNGILALVRRGVTEGCLPPLKDPIISWRQRGRSQRLVRIAQHRFRDADGNDRKMTRYGLLPWPIELAHESYNYLAWCEKPVARGRPAKIRKTASTANTVYKTIGQVAGYAVHVKGMVPELLTLRELCEPQLLEDFAWWWIERRGISTENLRRMLGEIKTIARYWLKDEDLARSIVQIFVRLREEAPPQPVANKRERWLSLEELDRIARSSNPINDRQLKESAKARAVMRHLVDPDGHPQAPSHLDQRPGAFGVHSLKFWAVWAEMELVIRLLIHRPLRIGNICSMTFNNLKTRPEGGYDIVFTKEEMKNGKYFKEGEWRERFPTRLLPRLHQWLQLWRPRLLCSDGRDADYVFLNTRGRHWTDSTIHAKFSLTTWRYTQDRPDGPVSWHPHLIRSTWPSEMLAAGLNPYIVRRIMGDSFKILEKHYLSYERQPPSPFTLQLAKEIEQGID